MRTSENGQPEVILHEFRELPKRIKDRELEVSFVNDCRFRPDDAPEFGLELGATVSTYVEVYPLGRSFHVYAEGRIAEQLLDQPAGVRVRSRVRTLFAVRNKEVLPEEGISAEPAITSGLLVTGIIGTDPA